MHPRSILCNCSADADDADDADDVDDADDAGDADDDLIILKDCWSIPTPHHPHLW